MQMQLTLNVSQFELNLFKYSKQAKYQQSTYNKCNLINTQKK